MGKPVEIQFTGLEGIQEILNKLPLQYAKKPVLAAFRKGSKPFLQEVKNRSPRRSGDMNKGLGVTGVKDKNDIAVRVGYKGGKNMPNWFKAYWSSYGTYASRSSVHQFVRARRSKSAKYKGGIKPKYFVDLAWDSTKEQVANIITKEIEDQTVKFLQKNAVK